MRAMMMGIAVLLLACGAFAQVPTEWDIQGGNNPQAVEITAQVKCYIQIIWQDTNIQFVNEVGDKGDWFRERGNGLIGEYRALNQTGDKSSCDPWADGYYESRDGAHFYIASNNNVTMTVHQNGDLLNQELGYSGTIPTWYTIAASGNWFKGFLRNSAWMNDGNIPINGAGVYGGIQGDGDPDPYTLDLGVANGCAFYPNQEAIPMAPASMTRSLSLPAVTRGTIEFKARMLRTGLGSWEMVPDEAGNYSTSLDVGFTSP